MTLIYNSNSYLKFEAATPSLHWHLSQTEKLIADGSPPTLKATIIINRVCLIKSAASCLCS